MWQIVNHYNRMLELVPMNDLKEHLMGDECWCEPEVDSSRTPLITHKSADNRNMERKLLMEPVYGN